MVVLVFVFLPLCYTHAEAQTAVQNVLELSEARDGQSMARDI